MQHGSASQIMGLWDTMGDQLSWADWFTSHQLSHLYLTRIIHIDTHSTSCYNNSQSQIFYSYAPTNGFFVSSFPVTCTRSQISEPLVRRTKPKDIGKPFFFVVNNIFLVRQTPWLLVSLVHPWIFGKTYANFGDWVLVINLIHYPRHP